MWTEVPTAWALVGGLLVVGPTNPWPRVAEMDLTAANVLRFALTEARERLGEPVCASVLDDFMDVEGRPLSARLDAYGMDVQRYLEFVVFRPASPSSSAVRSYMYTAPGSRVVFVRERAIERTWSKDPEHLVATLIHEVLHTLGLGENPPSSSEITAAVRRKCRAPKADPEERRSRPPSP